MLPDSHGLGIEIEGDESKTPRRVRLRSARGETVLDQRALFDALFGCADSGDPTWRVRQLEPVLGEAGRSALPIPFFVWGLESI